MDSTHLNDAAAPEGKEGLGNKTTVNDRAREPTEKALNGQSWSRSEKLSRAGL